jgi:hypothetical protein
MDLHASMHPLAGLVLQTTGRFHASTKRPVCLDGFCSVCVFRRPSYEKESVNAFFYDVDCTRGMKKSWKKTAMYV